MNITLVCQVPCLAWKKQHLIIQPKLLSFVPTNSPSNKTLTTTETTPWTWPWT